MARYGRDYGPMRGGYDRGFGGRQGGSFYGQGGGGFRRPGGSGYDHGYEGGGWGMDGLYNSIVGGSGERGGNPGPRGGGGGYDRDFYRRDYGRDRGPSPFGGMNPGGRSRFGSGYGGSERGENWRGFGGQNLGYDRSFGNARVNRNRYDRGWS